jgi:endoglucanase
VFFVRRFIGIATAGVLAIALLGVVFVPRGGSVAPPHTVPADPLPTTSEVAQAASSIDNSQAAPPAAAAPAKPLGNGPLHTDGGNIVDPNGQVVHISGVNWFGLETSTYAPQGLWARSLDSMLDQIVQSGFNTIRLPYSNDIFNAANKPNGIDYQLNPDLQGLTALQIMDQVVERAGARGLKVILDRHRPTAAGQSELWYTGQVSEQTWIDDWVSLAKRYEGDPTVIGADLHNEPHGPATWGDGNAATDWRAAAERAGNAVLQANPDWLIFVEGIEHQGNDWYWWGGDLAPAAQYPVEFAVANRLVYEAHDYGPGVSGQAWFQAPNFPQNLPGIWQSHWAFLKLQNIAPVLVGEFGGRSVGNDAEGAWQRLLVSYLQANSIDYTYWCWNPNSGDTGGVLEDDWTTLNPAKLSVLRAYQWPLIGSPVPIADAQSIIAAYVGPSATQPTPPAQQSPSIAAVQPVAPALPGAPSFVIGGPGDPDPVHATQGIGGASDPDPVHHQSPTPRSVGDGMGVSG